MYSSTAESKCLLAAARLFSGWRQDELESCGSEIKSRTRNSISSGSVSKVDMIFDVVLEAQIMTEHWASQAR